MNAKARSRAVAPSAASDDVRGLGKSVAPENSKPKVLRVPYAADVQDAGLLGIHR